MINAPSTFQSQKVDALNLKSTFLRVSSAPIRLQILCVQTMVAIYKVTGPTRKNKSQKFIVFCPSYLLQITFVSSAICA